MLSPVRHTGDKKRRRQKRKEAYIGTPERKRSKKGDQMTSKKSKTANDEKREKERQ